MHDIALLSCSVVVVVHLLVHCMVLDLHSAHAVLSSWPTVAGTVTAVSYFMVTLLCFFMYQVSTHCNSSMMLCDTGIVRVYASTGPPA